MQFTAIITALAMFASLGAASSQDMCRSAPIRLEACEGQLKRSVGMTSLPRHFLDSIKKARGVQVAADVVVEKK
ncbi:hypothetical protein GRF29_185g1405326 [Pseudopithomyces chartarum]|uniref:Uncharacterized protein n=1 Tax=Pseudopithomyces chartarum TaxID=1892770 RepID=A0AAN6LR61_9PLEO|nr:hypothetical protein GRF29_185g1405326 [Pseudopithomyces chartarum]